MRVSWLDLVGLDLVGFPLNHGRVQGLERARRETDYILHTVAVQAGWVGLRGLSGGIVLHKSAKVRFSDKWQKSCW